MKIFKLIGLSCVIFLINLLFVTQSFCIIAKFPGFASGYKDPSVSINFKTPAGMYEDVESEKKHGFYKIFVIKKYTFENTVMVMAVNCQPKNRLSNLLEYVKYNTRQYKSLYPEASFGIIKLPKNVTLEFDLLKIPYSTIMFESHSEKHFADSIVMFFETPKGFWSIFYVGPIELLKTDEAKKVFMHFIKNIRIKEIASPVSK